MPHSNNRILAQQGTFLTTALNSTMRNGLYDYLSVQDIKTEFEKYLAMKGEAYHKYSFMEEIYIEPHAVEDIRIALDRMEINLAMMYTEVYRKFSIDYNPLSLLE